jgi:ADP-ribose pyrophosphatase YjhB (NUDIX family)
MPKPITPFCGCDVFVTDTENQVLLIRRSDNGFWALPGGCQNLGETPEECAIRECQEESGYIVQIKELLGVWSSMRYEYINYPWKGNQFTHLLFRAEIVGGNPSTSDETTEIGWFRESALPPLSDGHSPRIAFGYQFITGKTKGAYYE